MDRPDHVLIVDDDPELRELLVAYLGKNGMRVTAAADGRQMQAALAAGAVDLIVLDLMLPGSDGLVLCRDLRAKQAPQMPDSHADGAERRNGSHRRPRDGRRRLSDEAVRGARTPGTHSGRVPSHAHAAAEHCAAETARGLAFGDWRLDTAARHLIDATGTMVSLSGAEYRLLRVFLDHPQQVLSREQLLNLTQGRELNVSTARSTCS